jgi:hypothetical protein
LFLNIPSITPELKADADVNIFGILAGIKVQSGD